MQREQVAADVPRWPLPPPPSRETSIEVPQLVGGRYRVLALRGSGAEASVYLAVDLFTDEEVALKIGPSAQLAEEYRRAAALSHPHLARAISLWRGAGGSSLAFEYGAEDLTSIRGAPEASVVRHVAEVARALAYLHRLGIVHGDVKPENVVLAGAAGSRRAVLVDLGLAARDRIARGSLEYAAAEVLEGAPPEPSSDLYSLGVLLHELLSGVNPFAAADPAEVIRAHFRPLPPPARASAPVQAIATKLLSREPGSRYSEADEVIEALAAATGLPLESEGEGLAPDRIGLGQLRGREAELARIETVARRVATGVGERILIVGPAGSGRSRLLRACHAAVELSGIRVLHLGREQGLTTLCRWLGLFLGIGTPLEPSPAVARDRLAAACAQQPLALLVDDADAAHEPLREVLATLGTDPVWNRWPLLVLAACSQPLPARFERIEMRPLPAPVAKAVVAEVIGPRPWADGLSDRLVREVPGYPAHLEDAVRDLARREVLQRRRRRWELDLLTSGADFGGCVPRGASHAAREAVRALNDPQRTQIGVAAVLWPSLEPDSLHPDDAALIAAGLRLADDAGLHSSSLALRRAAEAALGPDERRKAHLRAAATTDDPAARAHHLFRAKASGSTRAALAAAHSRLRAGAPLEASRLYQIACASRRRPCSDARSALLCERAGDCLALAGHPAAALQEYALALARGGSAARIWQKVAKARWQQGLFERVLAALSRAKTAGADPLAVATVEARAEAMRGDYARAEELACGALPLARARADGDAATRLHHLLGTSAWHRGDGRRAVAEERAAVLIARRQQDRRGEADARAGLGSAYRLLANHARSARETARAIALYHSLGDERQETIAWNNLGVARYLAGEWDGALEAWEKLTEKKTRTLEEELITLNNLGFLYRERGDWPRARELLRRALSRIELSAGYARIEAMILGNLGEIAAREGELAEAEALYGRTSEIARRIGARDEEVETARRRCELDLLRRDPAGASARASEALRLAVESANLVEQGNLWRILSLAARGRGDAPAAAAALRNAQELLRRAGVAIEMARCDCVECLLALDRGEAVQAAAALRRARTVFEKLGAAPDMREVERLQNDLEALQRKSFSHVEALTQAAQRLAVHGDPGALLENALDEALLLTGAERGFILLNEAGGEPRVAAVRGAPANAALRISRTIADRVLHTGEMVAVADIVGREELSTRKSILDLGLRSVLCAPIRFGGRQLGILYVDSRRVGSLLSEKDLALLAAFAALAGSALENARLIADLRRKGELLAHMAHEFRSPLQGITGYAELAKLDPGLDAKTRRGLDVISAQAMRLAGIVGRTLELSGMEAGAVALRREPVDLAEVTAAAIAGLQPIALMRSVEIALVAEGAVPRVLGDFDRLVQVITNLVGNAIQHSGDSDRVIVRIAPGDPLSLPRPAPRIEFDGGSKVDEIQVRPRPSAQVLVSDRGPGITPDDLTRLFTPFFRGRSGKGTGLGLVISREIVRQHGGEIRVESKPGEGSTFMVVLPGGP